MSLPEVLLWDYLRGGRLEGLRFRRQHPAGTYVLDFYCPAARLVVEVDCAHHDHPEQMHHDARRDAWLAERGIRMRVAASDILNDHSLERVRLIILDVASGAEVPDGYASPSLNTVPPPPPSAAPRKRGRINAGDDRDLGSSPVKRGRGTMRSMVEGAQESRGIAGAGETRPNEKPRP